MKCFQKQSYNLQYEIISAAHFLLWFMHKSIFRSSCTFFFQKQLHNLHSFCTKCTENFFNDYEKHLWWLLSWNRCISPEQCCYSIGLHNPFIIVSVQGYFMLINHVHLVPLILKQCLLPAYCFTIKQAGLIIIKRKAFRNHTLFCTFAALFITGNKMLFL